MNLGRLLNIFHTEGPGLDTHIDFSGRNDLLSDARAFSVLTSLEM